MFLSDSRRLHSCVNVLYILRLKIKISHHCFYRIKVERRSGKRSFESKMYQTLLVIVLCVPALSFNLGCLTNRFNRVVIFGDSYSDTGNGYRITNWTYPITPPYYRGRYSNGPMWVDRLKVLSKSNYAFASATTDNKLVQGLAKLNTVPVPGIRQQVATYLNKTHRRILSNIIPTLHIIWGGGNDFVFNRTISPFQSVNSLMNSVRDLLNAGAKNLLVFNQLPIQILPYSRRFNQSQTLMALTNIINNATVTSLSAIPKNYSNAPIYMFDYNSFITKVVSNTSSVKFANTVDGCWYVASLTRVDINCANPNEYVFIDNFHFTATVNKLIADTIQSFLSIFYRDNTPNSYFRSF